MKKVVIGTEQLYQGAVEAVEAGRFRDGGAFIWVDSPEPLEVWVRTGAEVVGDHIEWPNGATYRPGHLYTGDAKWSFDGVTAEG